MLSLFKNSAAIPVPLNREDNYHINPAKIEEEISRGTSVILTSNPRNPTGQSHAGCRARRDPKHLPQPRDADHGRVLRRVQLHHGLRRDRHQRRRQRRRRRRGRRAHHRRADQALPPARLAHQLDRRPPGLHQGHRQLRVCTSTAAPATRSRRRPCPCWSRASSRKR